MDELIDDALNEDYTLGDEEEDNNKLEEELHPQKRKVGRPRKNKINLLVTLKGIVNVPRDKDNVMELKCHDPSIFKKIICLLKSYQVGEVEFVFTKNNISISTEDHSKYTKMSLVIDCNKLFLYYLNDEYTEIRMCIQRNELDDIFNSIDKTYDQLSMWIKKEDIESSMNISLHHIPYNDDQTATIPVKQYVNNIQLPVYTNKDYPIQFTFSTKSFKQFIEKMSKTFPKICFSKESKEDSLIIYGDIEQGKRFVISFNENDKIQLIDRTNPDDITKIEVMSEHIILLAKTTMGDNITICIDNNKDILFQMELSDICMINVFTKIND
jgi:hypothetical protein